ncbi:MAG TPA: PepSY-associated TM helix domain-containing protein [Amaricoccus sp.]|uniref:PepSY-associated TM helix domain-containing protein n=1 Tax=Amaricoccus sp. TaxID=1872485 RepID=UPI002D116177|nr:PepSY-associated TM helix domain-containing protein [Amaricoccus sp.]HMQ91587.1 PepSY-associated TM helix domain-containing protein [Amaricoccus sp.]HMR51121.1 PepSY-associated TM helix domain-containing protein [Amaricoccus sp.]HMR59750.1 PepSY-associated TM helix domain-containing protein [Amaricoccus sp.]HMT98131.1 PepSY-associated TM helix domain-containing protein [Amaricoccus sp.]
MSRLSQAQLRRLTAVHGWSGTILGLLLYTVIATGTVAVFSGEIGRWSAGGVRAASPLDVPIDARIRTAAADVDAAYRDDIAIWAGEGRDIFAFFHTHAENPKTGEPDDLGTILRLDAASGEVLERNEGFIWDQPAAWEDSALRRFLVDLHVQLYLPSPWGLIVTGILGLAMMAAVISGLLMHRHLLRDLFVAERPGGRLVSARDRHVLAASWSLPFAFVLAFTGSFLSFASTIGFPLLASIAFGGDEEAMSAALFEPPVAEDAAPAPLADLDAILAESRSRTPGPVTFVEIARFGRADARVHVWHDPAAGGVLYVTNLYDGAAGAFLGRQPQVGAAPSVGGALYGLMYPLHFGHFAGVVSRIVWGALGVALCFVTLSGLHLWTRRRAGAAVWDGFARAVDIFAWGLPLAMLASAWGFLLAAPAADPFLWTPWSFVAGAAAVIAVGVAAPDRGSLEARYLRLLGITCVGLPVLRLAAGGMSWAEAILHRQPDVLTVDILLLLAGIWFLRRRRLAGRLALEAAE